GGTLPVIEVLLTALGYATGPLIANRKLADLPPVAVNLLVTVTAGIRLPRPPRPVVPARHRRPRLHPTWPPARTAAPAWTWVRWASA
ncbi:MAG TPA: hypothetical protein VHO07_00835, partial [Streptosporangiaceae bacterium]|nr:hypothetical protein [Streptosporangiaceae bacterium]